MSAIDSRQDLKHKIDVRWQSDNNYPSEYSVHSGFQRVFYGGKFLIMYLF